MCHARDTCRDELQHGADLRLVVRNGFKWRGLADPVPVRCELVATSGKRLHEIAFRGTGMGDFRCF